MRITTNNITSVTFSCRRRFSEELAPFLQQSGGELYVNAMPAGYLSLHADLLVHGSQPNHSARRRCGTLFPKVILRT